MNITDTTNIRAMRCFDIGGSKIVSADVSPTGDITELGRIETPAHDFERFCGVLSTLCDDDDVPVGVSIAGVVHPLTGRVISANVPCISGHDLASDLSVYLKRDVLVINDANAFALAEAGFGRAKDHDMVFAVILGTGIGGGIVLNGRIIGGTHGTAGEWGHGAACAIRTDVELPRWSCNCGQIACVDTLGGARGLERLYEYLDTADSKKMSSRSILEAWQKQEALATRVIDVWLDVVGSALASAVNLLGNTIVPVGGGLASSKPLIDALDSEVRNRCLVKFPEPLLYRAVSGPEQGLLGAALYALGRNT